MRGKRNPCRKTKKIRFSTGCIMLGLTVAYMAFSYAMYIARVQYWEERDIRQLTDYASTVTLLLGYHGEDEELYRMLCQDNMETSICDVGLYLDAREVPCLCRILFGMPKENKYHFLEGGFPAELSGQRAVVLGRNRKKDTHKVDGVDYFTVCHEEYLVSGYISSEHSGIYDDIVLLFWDNLGTAAKESVRYMASFGGGLFVQMESDDVDVAEFYSQRLGRLQAVCDYVMPMTEPVSIFSTKMPSTNYRRYIGLLYVFSAVIMVMSIEFWIYERKTELIIRRLVGYERWQLLRLVGGRLFSLMLPYSLLLLLVQAVLCLINAQGADMLFYLLQIGYALCFILLTFVILILYPMYQILLGDIVSSLGRVKRTK